MTTKDTLFRGVTTLHRTVFSATKGRIGGRGLGMPVLILTTTGRTTGKRRQTMTAHVADAAERVGLTLIGFLRDPTMVVYTGGSRVREPEPNPVLAG